METIRDRLMNPSQHGTLADLHTNWFETTIHARIPDYGILISDLGLPGRIRGAFGEVLQHSASPESRAGQPCPWSPPCAFEVLFRKQGRMEPGLDFPSPWVIALDCDGSDLLVSLSLFGFASEWASAAGEMFTQALRKTVNWNPKRKVFLPAIQFTNRRIEPVILPSLPDAIQSIELQFLTPVVLSSSSAQSKPASLITTLAARLSGLGRWHDLEISNDRSALREAAENLDYTWSEVETVNWTRGSNRQDRAIPMQGLRGKLLVQGESEVLAVTAPIITLGQKSFAGADVAFGCGRFVASFV